MNKHEIEKIAYELYQRDGCMPGRELEHWVEAERIFHSRHSTTASTVMPPISKKAMPAATARKKVVAKKSEVSESKTAKKMPAKTKPRKSGSSQKEASL